VSIRIRVLRVGKDILQKVNEKDLDWNEQTMKGVRDEERESETAQRRRNQKQVYAVVAVYLLHSL